METDFYRWLIGTAIALFSVGSTMLLAVVRWLGGRIDANAKAIKDGDNEVHARVTNMREDMTANYARRTDIDQHIARQETAMKEMRDEWREAWRDINKKIDTILAELRSRRD